MKFTVFNSNAATRAALYAGVAACSVAMPAVAFGQDAVDADEEVAERNVIVITASKRETTLQETPISVQVTSGETLERAQIRDLQDLGTVAPSLRASQNQNSASTTFIIRGFGNGANNAGIEPSVGVFIDGVYRSRAAAQIGDLANIQRIEVLNGPQSTLFGKNASAGVISVITREPQFDFGGSVEATYGNFNAMTVKGNVTGGLTETIAASFDANINKRDGFATVANLGGADINERDRWDLRGQILFEPSSDFKVRVIGDFSRIDELCCFAGNVVAGPTVPAVFAVGGNVDRNNIESYVTYLNVLPENEIDNYGGSIQMDYQAGPLLLTSITAYREVKSYNLGDVDYTSADIVNNQTDQKINTLTQELRISSDFDGPLNFLLGGYYFKEDVTQDSQLITGKDTRAFFSLLAGNPMVFNGVEAALGFPQNSIFSPGLLTDERFTLDDTAYSIFGTVDLEVTDRLTLTGGFNYTNDKKDFTANLTAFDELGMVNFVDVGIIGATGGTVNTRAKFQALPAATQAALLAGATNPALNPLLGLAAFQFQPPFVNVPNAVEDGKTRDDKLSYTLRAAYEVSRDINVYATYATGYKASSVNLSRDSRPFGTDYVAGPRGSTFAAPSSPIINAGLATPNLRTGTRFAGPEEAIVYELGIKGQFDRFGFNLAVFDQTLKGFQSNAFTGTGFSLTNAGSQSTQGFEFDATINPVDPLVFTFAMTYLDAVFDSFPGSSVGDLTGQTVAGVPPITIATSATYTHEMGSSGNRLIGRIDYSHESNVSINNGLPTFGPTSAFLHKREVNLVNASLTLALDNGLEVGVWGRNLTDDTFLTTVFDGVAQAGTVSGYISQPRTYGGTVKFKF